MPSTHTGPPQLSQGLMPHETNTRRKASKLNTNAIRPMMMPAVIPGHILTLDRSAFSSSSLVYFMIQSFLLQKPVFDPGTAASREDSMKRGIGVDPCPYPLRHVRGKVSPRLPRRPCRVLRNHRRNGSNRCRDRHRPRRRTRCRGRCSADGASCPCC